MSALEKKPASAPAPTADEKSDTADDEAKGQDDDVVIAEMDPDLQDRLVRKVLMKAEQYSSPHPHPDHLERYAALYPAAPEIVFEQFREQGDHRRAMEREYMKGSERRANLGQWLAFGLVASAIIAGVVVVVATGNAVAGATIIGAALGGGILLAIAGASGERSTMVQGSPTRRRSAGLGTSSAKRTGQPDHKEADATSAEHDEGQAIEPGEAKPRESAE